MARKKSLKTKLVAILAISIILPISILIIVYAIKFQNYSKQVAVNKANIITQHISDDIRGKLSSTFISLTAFEGIYKSAFNEKYTLDFSIKQIIELNTEYLKSNNIISSAHLLLEPNTYVDPVTGELNEHYVQISAERHGNEIKTNVNWDYQLKYGLYDKLKLKSRHDSIVEPYFNIEDGKTDLVISYIRQIYIGNKVLGATWFNISVGWIQNYLKQNLDIDEDAAVMLSSHYNMIISNTENDDLVGKDMKQIDSLSFLVNHFNNLQNVAESNGKIDIIEHLNFDNDGNSWHVTYSILKSTLFAETNMALYNRIIFGVLLIVLTLTFAYYTISKIVKRITNLSVLTKKFAKGDLRVKFSDLGEDEISELAHSLQNTGERFREILENINNTSKELYNSSSKIELTAIKLSEGASEQAASTQEVSASMEEMTANIDQNAENSKAANAIARKSAEGIEISSKNVIQTTNSMGEIANKTSIIGDIAFQTNILALNAAVEAARAGEHGKGFGVVAAEVGKLADNSKNAASEIDDLTNKSFGIAKKSGELLEQIAPDINKTAQLVQEITNASLEQKAGTEQINNAIQQLNNITQQNTGGAELLAVNVEALNTLADKLNKLIGFFKIDNGQKTRLDDKTKTVKNKTLESNISKERQPTKKTEGNLDLSKGFTLNLGGDKEKDDEFEKF